MFEARHMPYEGTRSFSKIVIDYLNKEEGLLDFYSFPVNLKGFSEAIKNKTTQNVDRELLVRVLNDQYNDVEKSPLLEKNISSLLSPKTYSVCTAHQPNLFTGPLYFIYKIIHIIKLAADLKNQFPELHFVPVYYMGSEDADLIELNHFTIRSKRYLWNTNQSGAFGKMIIDHQLIQLIDEVHQQIGNEKYANEIIEKLKESYKLGLTIQQATFYFVHSLFNELGLVTLIADVPQLKAKMIPIFEDDLFYHTPSKIVNDTSTHLNQSYKVQAYPRDINLFYFFDNIRNRIERSNDGFKVHETDLYFKADELKRLLELHPERFSPNVILRGLYQETILPNVCFVGGGGELAYWLQLKKLFEHYHISYPVLALRNSFLIIDKNSLRIINKLGLNEIDLFKDENEIMDMMIRKLSDKKISLNGKLEYADEFYEQIKIQAEDIDPTLAQHVSAIKTRSINSLKELEKKMVRAEKRKFNDHQRQIVKIRNKLFPNNGLQERTENIIGYYSEYGYEFIMQLYDHSLTLEQEFTILKNIGQ